MHAGVSRTANLLGQDADAVAQLDDTNLSGPLWRHRCCLVLIDADSMKAFFSR
jgi:hypothetical protein